MNRSALSLFFIGAAAARGERPCSDALDWLDTLPPETTPAEAWELCLRGDWLLWIAGAVGVARALLVLCACDCAERVLHLVPAGEDRPRAAIEAARRWAAGEATIEEAREAAYAARAALDDALDAAALALAALAAALAALAALAAAALAAAALAAARAARAALDAAALDDALDAAALAAERSEQARLVRARIPWALVADRIGGAS